MKPRLAFRRIQLLSRYSRATRRQFAQGTRPRDGEVKYEAPEVEEPPKPKATIQSRAIAVLFGAGIALAFTAYRRRNVPVKDTTKATDGFATFTLVDKEAVSSTSSIFTLKPLSSRIAPNAKVASDGGIYSVQLKQPQLQIARSYTMLPPIPGEPIDTLRLLIRKEEKGEVSGYLHTLAVGQDVAVRGPYKDYTFPQDTQQIIFLAGGTGIAPALKTADALASKADIHVLWANKRREDCAGGVSDTAIQQGIVSSIWSGMFGAPIQQKSTERNTVVLLLDLLKQQQQDGRLKIDYFVDEEHTQIRPASISKTLKSSQASNASKIIFISGPEGFINHWAGPKVFINGREEQGDLGGVLSRMDLHGWQVVKL